MKECNGQIMNIWRGFRKVTLTLTFELGPLAPITLNWMILNNYEKLSRAPVMTLYNRHCWPEVISSIEKLCGECDPHFTITQIHLGLWAVETESESALFQWSKIRWNFFCLTPISQFLQRVNIAAGYALTCVDLSGFFILSIIQTVNLIEEWMSSPIIIFQESWLTV